MRTPTSPLATTHRPTHTPQTDNAWYADLLLDSLASHEAFEGVIQPTGGLPPGAKVVRATAGIELISATPGAWCRHAAGASSYFDRLWKTGLSVHSATNDRFVLHVAVRKQKGSKSKSKRRTLSQ